jgi:cyclic pyranopterin phosphate synthase
MGTNQIQLIDQYDRHLNYMRISITDRCNIRCIYCMPGNGISKLRHEDIPTYEEILRIAGIAVNLGVDKIRLTGGEPRVRKGICEFIPRLTALAGLKEVSLTTNGIFLREKLENIKAGGINRINISLDSLHRNKYKKITGYDGLETVLAGIKEASKMGYHPIKINMVVMEGVNDEETLDFARLSLEHPYHIRFIEYMPVSVTSPDIALRHVPSSLIKQQIGNLGKLVPIPRDILDGPAERFKFEGAAGEIGFISPLTHHFCPLCNRLRLTSSGYLRPCLLSDQEVDLVGPMRNGASDEDLAEIFLKTALTKPYAHHLTPKNTTHLSAEMSSIGG